MCRCGSFGALGAQQHLHACSRRVLQVVERCNLYDELLADLLDQGVSMQRRGQGYGRDFHLALNFNVSQLANPGLIQVI